MWWWCCVSCGVRGALEVTPKGAKISCALALSVVVHDFAGLASSGEVTLVATTHFFTRIENRRR